jgi:Ni2+-binding GTPase involved in maturation of urease and hydrogenase
MHIKEINKTETNISREYEFIFDADELIVNQADYIQYENKLVNIIKEKYDEKDNPSAIYLFRNRQSSPFNVSKITLIYEQPIENIMKSIDGV